MQGWIKLHRQIKENWLYTSKPFCKFGAWVDILISANHDKAKFNMGTKIVDIEKGQFITSEIKLAEKWGWTRKTVRNFLKLLQDDGMITKMSTTKYTTITVVNWSLYQAEGQQKDNEGTTKEQQRDTNKNDKNEKKKHYSNFVLLTDEEYQNLVKQFGEKLTKTKIEELSLYIASRGDKYISHYATIINWHKKNNPVQEIKEVQPNPTYLKLKKELEGR